MTSRGSTENATDGPPVPISWFIRTLRAHSSAILGLLFLSVIQRTLGLLQPFSIQIIVDYGINGYGGYLLIYISCALFLCIMATHLSYYISSAIFLKMTKSAIPALGQKLFLDILTSSMNTVSKLSTGQIISRISEMEVIRLFLSGTISGVIVEVTFGIIYLSAMLTISPILTAIFMISIPTQIALGKLGRRHLDAAFRRSFSDDARYRSSLIEVFNGVLSVKSLSMEKKISLKLTKDLEFSNNSFVKERRISDVIGILSSISVEIPLALVVVYGSLLISDKIITAGDLIAFYLISGKLALPIGVISKITERVAEFNLARVKLGYFITEANSELDIPEADHEPIRKISISNIYFSYGDRIIFNNYSNEFRSGKITYIVGKSGSGKSTLGMIIAGLYQPKSGLVIVDTKSKSNNKKSRSDGSIVYLSQSPHLFSGSIRENLLLAKPDASQDEILSALNRSGLCVDPFFFPHGIDTEIGESGENLSGGQQQRLALARALLIKPQALILDEPTSALDEAAATIVNGTLRKLSQEILVIIISHATAFIQKGDVVVELT